MAYNKQIWKDYDDSKSESMNVTQGAVVTSDRMNNIENGIDLVDKNKANKVDVENEISTFKQETTAQFQQKAGKNEIFSMKNMGQDVKEAMSGGSVAVVGVNGITKENVLDNAVSSGKTDYVVKSKNLFDWSRVKQGFYVSTSKEMTSEAGDLMPSAQNSVTDYRIPVSGNTVYSVSPLPIAGDQPIKVAFFGANESFIEGKTFTVENTATTDYTVTSPEKAIIALVSCGNDFVDKLQFEKNNVQTSYELYKKPFLDKSKVVNKKEVGFITPEDTNFFEVGKNKVNIHSFTDGFYINYRDGKPVISTTNAVHEKIRVDEGCFYVLSPNQVEEAGFNYAIFDKNDVYLFGAAINKTKTNHLIKIPTNGYTLVFSCALPMKNLLQLEKGKVATKYETHYTRFKHSTNTTEDVLTPILYLGDSMGANSSIPTKISLLLNAPVINGAFGGGSLTYHITEEETDALSVVAIAEAIASGNFTRQTTAAIIRNTPYVFANLEALKKADYTKIKKCIIFAGTNDYGGARTIMGDGVDVEAKTFKSGIKKMINVLTTKYPNIQFYFITPIYRSDKAGNNEIGSSLIDYVNAEVEIVTSYGYPILNSFEKMGINSNNSSYYLKTDGLHPQTETGDTHIAGKIANFVKYN